MNKKSQLSLLVIVSISVIAFIALITFLMYIQKNNSGDSINKNMELFDSESDSFHAYAAGCFKELTKKAIVKFGNDSELIKDYLKIYGDECFEDSKNLLIEVSPPMTVVIKETSDIFEIEIKLNTILSREHMSKEIDKYHFIINKKQLSIEDISDNDFFPLKIEGKNISLVKKGEPAINESGYEEIIVKYYEKPNSEYELFLESFPIIKRELIYNLSILEDYDSEKVEDIISDMYFDELIVFDRESISYEKIKESLLKFDFVRDVSKNRRSYENQYRKVYFRRELSEKDPSKNDVFYKFQWYLENNGQFFGKLGADINIENAWKYTKGDEDIIISIIDEGLFPNKDFNKNIIYEKCYDFTDNDRYVYPGSSFEYHGTHIAGIISSEENNNFGIAGICPKCIIINMRVVDRKGSVDTKTLINAVLLSVARGAKIISLSLSGDSYSSYEEAFFARLYEKGITVVAAAGNNGSYSKEYPAAYHGVISVAATDNNDLIASYSNQGSWIDIAAPGDLIVSSCGTEKYCFNSGTSMAVPMITGTIGLMKSVNSSLSPSEILRILKDTADTTEQNYKRINAGRAVERVLN
ncbi:S8 family serine peptidase [Candidatus Pacearchaeota archaeon]|nr:S8 family serine peptidase [Candidatus Pacearchaeota archaeon]